MTYIKIDSSYYDLDRISRLIDVPKSKIEEIVDRGIGFLTEEQFLSKDMYNTIKKMKIYSTLVNLCADQSVISLLMDNGSQESIKVVASELLHENKIDNQTYHSLMAL